MYSHTQLRYLNAMGIPAWISRNSTEAVETNCGDDSPAVEIDQYDLRSWLAIQPLRVLGNDGSSAYALGPPRSDLLILSDCVTPEHSVQPFHGQAGKMLDAMLKAIGQSRRSCQLASLDSESLLENINLQQFVRENTPKVVLFFTQPGAAQHGLDITIELNNSDAKPLATTPESNCIVSYHPEFLLSHPEFKRQVWEHLKHANRLLG